MCVCVARQFSIEFSRRLANVVTSCRRADVLNPCQHTQGLTMVLGPGSWAAPFASSPRRLVSPVRFSAHLWWENCHNLLTCATPLRAVAASHPLSLPFASLFLPCPHFCFVFLFYFVFLFFRSTSLFFSSSTPTQRRRR